MNDEIKLAIPHPPAFRLSDDEIEMSLATPIHARMRQEIVLPADATRPNAWNRIIATGVFAFKDATGMPVATLMRQLLAAYFMGRIVVLTDGYEPAQVRSWRAEADDTASDVEVDHAAFGNFPGFG